MVAVGGDICDGGFEGDGFFDGEFLVFGDDGIDGIADAEGFSDDFNAAVVIEPGVEDGEDEAAHIFAGIFDFENGIVLGARKWPESAVEEEFGDFLLSEGRIFEVVGYGGDEGIFFVVEEEFFVDIAGENGDFGDFSI